MSRLRPAIIPSVVPYQRYSLPAAYNNTEQHNPTNINTVWGCEQDIDNIGTNQVIYGWVHFRQPLYAPLLYLSHVTVTNAEFFVQQQHATFVCTFTAMSVDWDPTTLCWNNQPTPAGDDLSSTATLNQLGDTSSPEVGAGTGVLLDHRKTTKIIYGFRATVLQTGSGFPVHGELDQMDAVLIDDQTRAWKTLAVASRSSSTTTRTLVFGSAHGLNTGTLVTVRGVDSRYDTLDASGTFYSVVGITVVDSVTIQYALAASVTESSTACGGSVSYYPASA